MSIEKMLVEIPKLLAEMDLSKYPHYIFVKQPLEKLLEDSKKATTTKAKNDCLARYSRHLQGVKAMTHIKVGEK